MKAILMSIRPEWVAKILNGEKTIEIRKKFPSDYVGWVYIYCTKSGEVFKNSDNHYSAYKNRSKCIYKGRLSNGVVVARFWCDKVEKINAYSILDTLYETTNIKEKELLKVSCLTYQELNAYLKHKIGYAIHISELEIFDKPKEISEFYFAKTDKLPRYLYPLTRAPQSYCFIEV